MLGNKKFNLFLSVIFAIGLWIYVVGEVNPQSEERYKNIPITYVNQEKLKEKGLALSSISADNIDIDIRGTRSDLAKVKKDDITAFIDLGELLKGENEITVNVRVPDGIEVVKKSMNKIIANVEALKKKKVKVRVVYQGKLRADSEAVTVGVNYKEVEVSGAETLVEKVKEIHANIDVSKVKDTEKIIGTRAVPVDKAGREVDRIEVQPKEIVVTSILSRIKLVDLNVPIVNNSNVENMKLDFPKKVFIAGRADLLKDISSITSEPVDVTGASKGETFNININLPDGVSLSRKNSELQVKVISDGTSAKNYDFDISHLKRVGENAQLNYKFEDNFKVNVSITGTEELIKNIKKEDLDVAVDLTGLNVYDTKAKVTVNSRVKGVSLAVSPQTVHVEITKKE